MPLFEEHSARGRAAADSLPSASQKPWKYWSLLLHPLQPPWSCQKEPVASEAVWTLERPVSGFLESPSKCAAPCASHGLCCAPVACVSALPDRQRH